MDRSTSLKLYNTLTRKKELLVPIQDKTVTLYTCGPTVYNYAHIGNFRTYLFEDLLRRTIQFFGFRVVQVMNLTDVDDKTIKGAIAQNVSLNQYTQVYKQAFFRDLKSLNIQPAEHYPEATQFIPEMIRMIEELLAKGYAYHGTDGSIYYSIRKFAHYGCLSHFHLDELEHGASHRIAHDEYDKENAADFVLWKGYDPSRDGAIFWESPFGKGRPGWHLECSAMAIKLLGETLDIHVGGVDNMFPHHENEIAQSEACSGKKFVNLWMHAEHLIVDGKKMSKSLGNYYLLQNLLDKGYTGRQIRYLLLQTHYRTQLNFTLHGLEAAKESLHRIDSFIQRLQEESHTEIAPDNNVQAIIGKTSTAFAESLADDLNISVSLAALYEFIRQINGLCDQHLVSGQEAKEILAFLQQLDQVLGVFIFARQEEAIPQELQEALQKRIQARKDKDWLLADELRKYIVDRGYLIEDTPQGVRLKKG